MKQLLGTLCALMLLFVCNDTFAQKAKMHKAMKSENISYPYTADYSSDWVIGNPENSKMILELWKDYDNNDFDKHADYFADTMVMFLPNGMVIRGKDSVLAALKGHRGSLSSATDRLVAWVPLKTVNTHENWVALWGNETDTWADGKTVSMDIQEVWRINKDGKVDFLKQYESKPAEQQ